jgi:hypothetical protein
VLLFFKENAAKTLDLLQLMTKNNAVAIRAALDKLDITQETARQTIRVHSVSVFQLVSAACYDTTGQWGEMDEQTRRASTSEHLGGVNIKRPPAGHNPCIISFRLFL